MINLVDILACEEEIEFGILQIIRTIKGGVSTGYKAPRVDQLYDGINGVTRQRKI